jgi:hypothetical protein
VQVPEVSLQLLPVLLLRDFIHTDRRIFSHALIGAVQSGHIDPMGP